MIKLRGFGGDTEFWDHNLESFTLMAGLAAVTSRIKLFATAASLVIPPRHRGTDGVHDRLDLRWAVRPEPDHRLAAAGILADGTVAR